MRNAGSAGRRVRSRYRGVAITAMLAAVSAGCTSRQAVEHPAQYILEERPGRIWISQGDGTLLEVSGPRLLGDTLAGFFGGQYQELVGPDLAEVYADRLDRGRTTLLVGGVAAGIAFASYMLWGRGEGDPDVPDPEGEEVTVVSGALIPLLRLQWR